jgi:hypothetical protein
MCFCFFWWLLPFYLILIVGFKFEVNLKFYVCWTIKLCVELPNFSKVYVCWTLCWTLKF